MSLTIEHWHDLDAPAQRLLGAADAERELGIRAGTVRQWAHRGLLHPRGLDARDRPLYGVGDLIRLRG